MTTYVLIPGFWLGAWAWQPVTRALRTYGHDVHPVSLTGLGERVHLARTDTDLEVHITDVLNLLHYEDLRDVVLVGHSYAGAAVSPAVADRAGGRVAKLVFVDTGPLPDGVAQAEFGQPEEQERNAKLVASAGDGWRLPPPPWAALATDVANLDPSVVDLLNERSVQQPWATATTPVRLAGAWETLPRVGIMSSFTAEQARGMAAVAPIFQHMDGAQWQYEDLPTWHWPMLSRPADLAELLHRAA
jgi:pimeloyl-ACP methyl ester carboxylesterase